MTQKRLKVTGQNISTCLFFFNSSQLIKMESLSMFVNMYTTQAMDLLMVP